jgi:Fic-DOC domain mobile mystery protein B
MLQLHREMFGDVWEWAGVQRKTRKNIGIAATSITVELKKLEGDAAYWTEHRPMDPVEIAARIHHRAVHIHPFENGNGRWARHLANIWLRREGHPLTMWPERTVGEASPLRDDYLDAIRAADDGNLEPLIALHRRHSRR